MEHLGNKVTFRVDEIELYEVSLDGTLTITLKQDVRTDPAHNLEDQNMPKINGAGVPSYEGHEGVVQSASGLQYNVDPADGNVVGGFQTGPANATHLNAGAGDPRERDDSDGEDRSEVYGREVGLVTEKRDEDNDTRTDEQRAEDEAAGNERETNIERAKGETAEGEHKDEADKPTPLEAARARGRAAAKK
jgi:hypothetical protein